MTEPENEYAVQTSSGGIHMHRGVEFQAGALLYYFLVRRRRCPDIRMRVETIEDAVIEYPPPEGHEGPTIIELVQCKIRQDSGSKTVLPGYGTDTVQLGTFTLSDLVGWVDARRPETNRLLALGTTFFTGLILGKMNEELASFQPKPTHHGSYDAFFWFDAPFNDNFPYNHVHPQDPAARVTHTLRRGLIERSLSEPARRRVRIVSFPPWRLLRTLSEILVRDNYQVGARFEAAVREIIDAYRERALAKDPENKVLSPGDIETILAKYRTERGRWMPAKEWLGYHEEALADPNCGELPGWQDFKQDRYVHRPEFDEGIQRLQDQGFIHIHGHPGAGKTTLARFLAFRYLSQNATSDGYYLCPVAGVSLTDESRFLESKIQSPSLFILDDAQFTQDETRKLLQAYTDSRLLGTARARFIVVSTHTYSQRMLGKREKADDPLTRAAEVRFEKLSNGDLKEILEEMCSRCGLVTPLPHHLIAHLAGGRLGPALIIARAARGLGDHPSVQRLIKDQDLHRLLQQWILQETGLTKEPNTFQNRLVPVFIASTFGVPLGSAFAPGIELLRQAGFIESNGHVDERQGTSCIADRSISFIISGYYKPLISKTFEEFFESDRQSLPVICQRLAKERFGHKPLIAFFEACLPRILTVITEPADPLNLMAISTVLGSVSHVSRAGGRKLFRALAYPEGKINLFFFDTFICIERAQDTKTIFLFFNTIFAIDRYAARRLAGTLQAHHADFLIGIFELPDTLPDAVAKALCSIHRCSRGFALELCNRLETSTLPGKLRELENEPHAFPVLLRYCEALYPVQRNKVYALLNRYFTPELVSSFFLQAADETLVLLAYRKLYRLRPRAVADAIMRIWQYNRHVLVSRCTQQQAIVGYINPLFLIRGLNRWVAKHLVVATMDHGKALFAKETDYQNAASALSTLKRIVGDKYALQLSESICPESIVKGMRDEPHRFIILGRSLANLTKVNPDLGSWLEEHLNLKRLVQSVSKNALADLSYLINGFLSAVEPGRSEKLRNDYLQDATILSAFCQAWRDDRSLALTNLCIELLTSAGMSKREIAKLTGQGNPQSFDNNILERFTEERSLLDISNGLYLYASLHDETDEGDLAEEALIGYVDRLKTEFAVPEQPRTGRLFQRPGPKKHLPKGFEPSNLVEIGKMLRVAAAIDPGQALELAQQIELPKFVSYAEDEPNLGRLAVFIAGLHDASRAMCHEFISRLIQTGILEARFYENEKIANVIHLVRNIGRVSRAKAAELIRVLVERFGEDIKEYVQYEANLMEISNWLRVLNVGGSELVRNQLANLRAALREAEEYDSGLQHLLEASEAMIECKQTEEAKRYALMALEQSRQFQAERSLQRLVVVLQKAVRNEQQIGLKGYAARLFEPLDEGRFNLMLMRETAPGAACNPVIVAFSCYLFKSIQDLGFERFASSIDSMASLTLEGASREKRTVYRALMQVLCAAPPELLAKTAESWGWKMPWERGLVDVLFHTAYPGMESPFTKAIETERTGWPSALPFEFCEHAGNVKYGLCYRLIGSIDVSNEFINRLRTEASNRAEDEILSATKWLLQIPSSDRGIPPLITFGRFLERRF